MKFRSMLLATACLAAPIASAQVADGERVHRLLTRNILVDTHIDVPYRIQGGFVDVSKATEAGEFDLPRARTGGLDAPFMSIYTPASLENKGGAWALANQLIDRVEAIVGRAPDKFALAPSVANIRDNFAMGKLSLPMGMENGSPLEGDLKNVQFFYDRGIRYITLAHSQSNHICDSSYSSYKPWDGLSPFGEQLITEMNRVGIMIDISHVSDAAFFDVLRVTQVPVIASHSSLRHFTPGFERNMSDDMLRALKQNGGVLQINFGSTFISEEAYVWNEKFKAVRQAFMDAKGVTRNNEKTKAFTKQYKSENPYPFANLSQVLDHFDRAVTIAGIDYVGIGSDYDGVGDSLPTGLKDVSQFGGLIQGLINRGYSDDDIRKIMGENLLRVWSATEAFAEKTGGAERMGPGSRPG